MPTARPRHVVTESDELAAALDDPAAPVARRQRGQLLVKLALAGHASLQHGDAERHRSRLDALRCHSGSLTGAYGEGYLRKLREDWPS